jgi:hypothetical protein
MVHLEIGTKLGPPAMQIGFTDQRLTVHDGLVLGYH